MSERSDQGAPLFPRRTLTGPPAEESAPETTERRSQPARDRQSERARDGGPPTAAMAPPYAPPAPTTAPPAESPAPSTAQPTAQADKKETRKPTRPARPSPAAASKPRGQAPRKARLRIVRLDPWSVMKMAFALSVALAIVTVIAVAIVWAVLDAAGVWEAINSSVDALRNARTGSDFDVIEYAGFGRVMGLAMVVSAANIVLLTALATLGAFLYNLAAALLGGFEVTLAEDR